MQLIAKQLSHLFLDAMSQASNIALGFALAKFARLGSQPLICFFECCTEFPVFTTAAFGSWRGVRLSETCTFTFLFTFNKSHDRHVFQWR